MTLINEATPITNGTLMTLMPKGKVELLHPELSYEITGLCYQAHNELGRFCSERQYADKLETLLRECGIKYVMEFDLSKFGMEIEGNRVDFLVEDKIIIDIKAKKFITKDDYYQMLKYLKCANLNLGLVINFRNVYLKPKRIINLS